jgi:hypothetical protein
MSFPFGNMFGNFGNVISDENADPNTVYLIGMRYKPIVLAPGQTLNDIPFDEQIERGIDWDSTARASAVITNIGEGK